MDGVNDKTQSGLSATGAGFFLIEGDSSGAYYSNGNNSFCGYLTPAAAGLSSFEDLTTLPSAPAGQAYAGLCTQVFLIAGDSSGFYYSTGGSSFCGYLSPGDAGLSSYSGVPTFPSAPAGEAYAGLCPQGVTPTGLFSIAGDSSGVYYSNGRGSFCGFLSPGDAGLASFDGLLTFVAAPASETYAGLCSSSGQGTGTGLPYMIGYKSDGTIDAPTTMKSWLGRPIDIVGATITTTNWIWSDSFGAYPDSVVLNISFPMVSGWDGGDNGGYTDMAKAADGSYDDIYAAMAQNLAGLPNKTAVVAIGWENTGGWYPWSVGVGTNATAQNYIDAFRRIAITVKTYNPNALVEFCMAWGGSDPGQYWPGAYDPVANPGGADVVSMDVYEANVINYYNNGNPITWAGVQSNTGLASPGWHDLDSMVDFAQSNGVKIGMREWGSSGDDGAFVAGALAWMNSFPPGLFIYNLFSDDAPADNLQDSTASPNIQQAYIDAYRNTHFAGTWWHGGP